MLVLATLLAGALLIGILSFRKHDGDCRRAVVDTAAWLIIAGAGVVANHVWPRNDLVLAVALVGAFVVATLLRNSVPLTPSDPGVRR